MAFCGVSIPYEFRFRATSLPTSFLQIACENRKWHRYLHHCHHVGDAEDPGCSLSSSIGQLGSEPLEGLFLSLPLSFWSPTPTLKWINKALKTMKKKEKVFRLIDQYHRFMAAVNKHRAFPHTGQKATNLDCNLY